MKPILCAKPLGSKVAKKLTKKMFFIYLGIYIFILLLLLILITPQLYKTANAKAADTLAMISDEIGNSQESLRDYTNTLYSYKSLLNHLKEYKLRKTDVSFANIEQELSNYVAGNSLLLAATIEDMDHTYFSSSYYRNVVDYDLTANNPHYQLLFGYPSGSFFSYISPDIFQVATDIDSSYHTLVFSKIMVFDQIPYIVTCYYNMNTVFSHCKTLQNDIFAGFAIVDRMDGTLYRDGTIWEKESITDLFTYTKITDSKRTAAGNYYYIQKPSTGWYFVAYAPNKLLFSDFLLIFGLITILYLISPILYAFFLVPATTKLLSPLAVLYNAMCDYTTGEPVPVSIKTSDEIEELSDIYNEMTIKISNQIDDIKNKEHVNAVVNYKLLATQIDPHFIYNTMNIINIMARQGNTTAIIEINSALIKILRERLNSKLSISDTIENELDSLYQFNLIMDYRYENSIHTMVDIDSSLLQNLIPKNILQPLVENAFYHGFSTPEPNKEGNIDVMIYAIEEELVIEISDNGAGISEERLSMLMNRSYHIYDDQKPHIGLDNIRQRLEYVYHGNYQFNIQSIVGYGTTISITIPLGMPD